MKNRISSLIIFIFCFTSPVLAEVFYCSGDEATGFSLAENYKIYKFKPKRFQVDIDWENKTMISQKIFLDHSVKCINKLPETLYCISGYGTTLAVNKKTLKYHRSSLYLTENDTDSMTLEHGRCEKF